MESFKVITRSREELIEITGDVARIVAAGDVGHGACLIYTTHTTAGITINENADPDVTKDLISGMASLNLDGLHFRHREGNSPAHIKSSIIGCSVFLPILDGRLMLGTWQGIYFWEFDGPRTRNVTVTVFSAPES